MHKKAQFGKVFDGATAARKSIVGKGMIFLLLGCFSTSDVVVVYASRQI
jgi:hypothetical protein